MQKHDPLPPLAQASVQSLDRIDRRILDLLQREGRMSNVELAKQVNLSPTPCLRRVHGLEESGIITGYRAMISRQKLGLGVRAFIGVRRDKAADRRKLWHHMTLLPEVMGCYVVSGGFDLLLDVLERDLEGYSNALLDKILSVPGVVHVESMLVLREVTANGPVPIPA